MNFQQLLSRVGVPILGIGLIAMAYRWYGWPGVVAAFSGEPARMGPSSWAQASFPLPDTGASVLVRLPK